MSAYISCSKAQMVMAHRGYERPLCRLPHGHRGPHKFAYKNGDEAGQQRAWFGFWAKPKVVRL